MHHVVPLPCTFNVIDYSPYYISQHQNKVSLFIYDIDVCVNYLIYSFSFPLLQAPGACCQISTLGLYLSHTNNRTQTKTSDKPLTCVHTDVSHTHTHGLSEYIRSDSKVPRDFKLTET